MPYFDAVDPCICTLLPGRECPDDLPAGSCPHGYFDPKDCRRCTPDGYCPSCGTYGEHYCPSDVDRGDES